ncbi:binding partner of ACD11 1-like [Durio zibethinus]|uniref:Binding partner of ACD11 1-like n=1 Tax=Durio zibethinus TaxID=66656 RepID=A0A6P5Z6C4_DURZI|nr:binding partner of ACD11 1-like [Durio zibethinus]
MEKSTTLNWFGYPRKIFIVHPVTSLATGASLGENFSFSFQFYWKEKKNFSGEERFDLFCHKRNSMAIQSVKVCNVSLGASEQDIKEFFSFSGEIEHVEMHGDNERSQVAYVAFKDPSGAETAVLLSGATIVDQSVNIELAPDYKPPATSSATPATENKCAGQAISAVQKAEDVVSSMLAGGFILGKDAVNKAKAFDEKHQLTSTATAKVASLDQKIGLTEKISAGTTMVNDKVREMDQKFQVSEKTKSAFTAAEQTVSNAGSAVMKNRYVLTGASWVTGAFNRVAKVAGDVGQKTKEKVLAEEEQAQKPDHYAQINKSESPKDAKPATSDQPSKPSSAQGLIL